MKINRLRLKNIRCFEDLTLELGGESALVIGDNGDGKSTVLRSIAMGLCDDSSASALFRDLYGDSVRQSADEGTIEVELEDGNSRFQTQITIRSLRSFECVEQALYRINKRKTNLPELKQDDFPWEGIFAVGYGPGIRVQGTADYDYYLTVDALYPLFVYDRPLQNPELVIRRLIAPSGTTSSSAATLDKLRELLKQVLQLESEDRVELTKAGIEVRTRQGQYALSSLGDGYRSTMTWVLDMISWWFLKKGVDFADIDGIVLIDEIEQHLHPHWQRNIMRLLTQNFPKVQFIATTHSPLVASGCEHVRVHRLNDDRDHDTVQPYGWRAEEVYEMMGLPTSRAELFARDLQDFQELDDKLLRDGSLSPEDEKRFRQLREKLDHLPPTDPVRLATELENLARFARESSQRGT